jgi:hypothetical protein
VGKRALALPKGRRAGKDIKRGGGEKGDNQLLLWGVG